MFHQALQTLSGPLSGSGETIGHIVARNELSHTNLFLFYAASRHKQNKRKRNTKDNGTEREHAAQRALPILCCPPAVKRLKSYFEF